MRLALLMIPLLVLAPLAGAVALPAPEVGSICHSFRAGEGETTYCVNPGNPGCLVEETVWTGADGWSTCTGL